MCEDEYSVVKFEFGPNKSQMPVFMIWKEYRNHYTDKVNYAEVLFSIKWYWVFYTCRKLGWL